jgi:hypothetical protein
VPRKNTRLADRFVGVLHGYNREKSRTPMFKDDEDRRLFKSLFERYLSAEPQTDSRGRPYKNHRAGVRLLALTIKTNHFHVALLQLEPMAAGALMQAVMTTYVRYFNKKYGSSGAMFEGEVRLRPAKDLRDELHLIAYVHENHGDDCYCEFCSHSLYVGHPSHVPSWIDVAEGLARYRGVSNYLRWLRTRQAQREVLGGP